MPFDEKAFDKALALHPLPIKTRGYLKGMIKDYEATRAKQPISVEEKVLASAAAKPIPVPTDKEGYFRWLKADLPVGAWREDLIEMACNAAWRRDYPNGGSLHKTYDGTPYYDKQLYRKEVEPIVDAFVGAGKVIRTLERESGWQPIETAPRDGTYVLCYWTTEMCGYDKVGMAFCKSNGAWDIGWWVCPTPVGWMPLPKPPTDIEDETGK